VSTTLPWDEFYPDEPELPYEPPAPVIPPEPEPVIPPIDRPRPPSRPVEPPDKDAIEDALNKALEDLWPAVKDKAFGYVQDTWEGVRDGQTVDVLHPTVISEDLTGKELVVADAKSRSWRTLVQGLIVDVVAAIVLVLGMLTQVDIFAKESWILIGALLCKSVATAVLSYVMRLKVTPTIKTEGEKLALMPIPRPMMEEERNQ
jgi:hypothetical protein